MANSIYRVQNLGTFTTRDIEAGDHTQAVAIAARRDGYRNTRPLRVTGISGLSGIYQLYKPVRGGGETSCGPTRGFHVTELS